MLADSVRTPDTIRESGRNLLAYRVRGGHYPRPDAIRCDTGTISRKTGSLSFEVRLSNGQTVRRHCDHLRPRVIDEPAHHDQSTDDWAELPDADPIPSPTQPSPPPSPPHVPPRRSGRVSMRPDRLVDHM